MNIYAASDIHGDFNLLHPQGADIYVIAGDIAPTPLSIPWSSVPGFQENWINDSFIPFLKKFPDTMFIFTPGNHDFWGKDIFFRRNIFPVNAKCLVDEGFVYKGHSFYGTPWCPTINGIWAFEGNSRRLKMAFENIPTGLDVLITHTPPFIKWADIDISLDCNNTFHLGSLRLTEAIEIAQPNMLFCGHIHSGNHNCFEIGKTKCFNVSLVDERYQFSYTQFVGEI